MAKLTQEQIEEYRSSGLSDTEIESMNDDSADEERLLRAIVSDDEESKEQVEEPKAQSEEEKPEDEAQEADEKKTEPEDEGRDIVIPQLASPDKESIEDYEAQREALLEKRKLARAQYRSGDIGAEEYDQQIDEINEQINLLDRRYDRQVLTDAYNKSLAAASASAMLSEFKREVRQSEGVDYDSNPVLLNIWDSKMKALAAQPENATKPYSWFLRESHKLAMEDVRQLAKAVGVEQKPSAPKAEDGDRIKKAVAEREQKHATVKSLAKAPSAADTQTDTDEFAYLDGLSGIDLEQELAKLSPAQQKRYLEG